MEININSPAYFSQLYGIDDEVYRFCQKIYLFFQDKKYSETLNIIGIVPVVAPKEIYEAGKWKESIKLISNKSCATITIRMDFEEYYNGDSSKKILLTKNMVLKAVQKIKSKVSFDYDGFKRDFAAFFEVDELRDF